MKYFLTIMLTLTGWLAAPVSAEESGAMVVETNGGEKVMFFFDQKPEMTFSGANVEINSTAETVMYPMNDVMQIYFDQTVTGIGKTALGEMSFRFADGQLSIEGLSPATAITVYSAGGAVCLQGKADANGRAELSTGTLSRGVYVVKTGKVTYKIVKK